MFIGYAHQHNQLREQQRPHHARVSHCQQSIYMRLVCSTSHQYFGRGLLSWTEMKNVQQSQGVDLL